MIIYKFYLFQLSKFVMSERSKHTIYPPAHDVFSWTNYCSIDKVRFHFYVHNIFCTCTIFNLGPNIIYYKVIFWNWIDSVMSFIWINLKFAYCKLLLNMIFQSFYSSSCHKYLWQQKPQKFWFEKFWYFSFFHI